jgi:predicted site-specific integrase-resolvase
MNKSIGQAANMMGVSISTLRRWEHSKKFLPEFKTVGGHRRYSIVAIKTFLGKIVSDKKRKIIGYARVSSYDQKDD